jgi:ATP-dependent Clp protease ATP-binding subunit ClpE
MVTDLNEMLRDKGIVLEPEPGVAEFLVSHCCSDPSFGARPLRRGVQTHIEDPLAEWLLANPVAGEVRLALAVVDGRVALTQLDPVSISW